MNDRRRRPPDPANPYDPTHWALIAAVVLGSLAVGLLFAAFVSMAICPQTSTQHRNGQLAPNASPGAVRATERPVPRVHAHQAELDRLIGTAAGVARRVETIVAAYGPGRDDASNPVGNPA